MNRRTEIVAIVAFTATIAKETTIVALTVAFVAARPYDAVFAPIEIDVGPVMIGQADIELVN